jgi:hypothetical protein
MVIEKKLNSPTILVKIIVSRNCLNFLLCSFIVVSSVMLAANGQGLLQGWNSLLVLPGTAAD